ncbi:hypothetical protein KKC88_00710 [Patescibacteria group bacterium]|nr:hypothetical protein [Patescibacteria group bacterium]MBU1673766.1 hypothetical protein [Patescibacteria group bacterium]MBU1964106.1 hypothetical protein [Patescibacteria group bacterium]
MYLFFGIGIVLSGVLFVAGNHTAPGKWRAFFHHSGSMLAGGVIVPGAILALAGVADGPLVYAGRSGVVLLAVFVGFLPALFRKEV